VQGRAGFPAGTQNWTRCGAWLLCDFTLVRKFLGAGSHRAFFSGLPPEIAEGAVAVGPFSIFRVTLG